MSKRTGGGWRPPASPTQSKGKLTPTPTAKSVFARQRDRAESVLEFLQVRRERSDKATEKARKVAAQERQKSRRARGYDLPFRPSKLAAQRPYTQIERDRSLRGKDRIRARRAGRR